MKRALRAVACLAAQVGVASTARAEETTPSHKWFGRAELGLRSVMPSEQLDLLAEDGYPPSARFVVGADFNALVTRIVGIGAWVDFSHRSAEPPESGPRLTESVFAFGVGAPVLPWGWESSGLLLEPKLGYGWSWMSIGGHANPVGAITYGGDIGVVWPRAHLTLAIGWLNGATRPPGELGRRSNFGGVSLLVGGAIDG